MKSVKVEVRDLEGQSYISGRESHIYFDGPAVSRHHALDIRAANQNFGVLFSFWDRIFRTYVGDHPKSGQQIDRKSIDYGLQDYREPGKLNLGLLMLMPFKRSQASQEESPGN